MGQSAPSNLKINEACSVKRGLEAFAKSIDPCQPAQFAPADMGRNFSLQINFLHIKGPFYLMIRSVSCSTKWILWIYNEGLLPTIYQRCMKCSFARAWLISLGECNTILSAYIQSIGT